VLRWLLAAQDPLETNLGSPGELGLPQLSLSTGLTRGVNALFVVAGALSVVFIVVGGLRYVMSNGEPKDIEAAKNTIMYAVLGLIISLLSFGIVNFVISRT
jgi:hypothetical protein